MSGSVEFTFELDKGEFAVITAKLRELAGNKARTYIARALNKTATTARQKLANKARDAYTVKSRGFKSDMQIKRATAGDLEAIIRSHGDTLAIPQFKYTFSRPSPAKVDIVKSGLKPIIKYGNKAFLGQGRLSGGKHVFVRTGKAAKRYKGMSRSDYKARTGRSVSASREGLEKIKGKSVPYMLGSEPRVWGPTRPQIESDLKKYMNQQIKALLG